MSLIRLDKFLADSGEGTRTQVKDKIKKGRVTVNGVTTKQSDLKVNTDKDVVTIDGKELVHEAFEYFMLNKPMGVVSATTDARDKTVVELIVDAKRRDLFPVGRLDKDTEGLLIITNDGPLANSLLAPGKHVAKLYEAKILGNVTEETVRIFKTGVDIGDDKPTAPAVLEILEADGTESYIRITITEGRYHQIKRMFKAVGMEVTYLKRISMGPLTLDKKLAEGEYRRLTEIEIKLLKEFKKDE